MSASVSQHTNDPLGEVDGIDPRLSSEDLAVVNRARSQVERRLAADAARPLTVAVMGATGVGKSSLVNALFDTQLPTDPVRPCTTEPTTVHIGGSHTRHALQFIDLPGYGEGVVPDARYMTMYLSHLRASDVVIWAIHADSRNLSDDRSRITQLIEAADESERTALVSKIAVVLTKADQLHVDPWILPIGTDQPGNVQSQPGPTTRALLSAKCRFAYEQLLAPFGAHLRPSTYNDGGPSVDSELLTADEFAVRLHRPLSDTEARQLKTTFPELTHAIDRLRASTLPGACSARLQYNLTSVLTRVVDRLDPSAMRRLRTHVNIDGLDRMATADALGTCNLMVVDLHRRRQYRFSGMLTKLVGQGIVSGVCA